ncbi:uncharacterized protein LOC120277179 [Dioscorea cayenensis subsp. rotundata]|uniref:Uncharacterized protein LOC120277179 n=1 Tax=Dioscorea cayennensis subsp. rotundata TaxID=55577 RepID=A0AB40CMS8_DIOCR|nr:uncharacterized protein LOC120277179 [Dioscorea cayenensis subsp. rotundata]
MKDGLQAEFLLSLPLALAQVVAAVASSLSFLLSHLLAAGSSVREKRHHHLLIFKRASPLRRGRLSKSHQAFNPVQDGEGLTKSHTDGWCLVQSFQRLSALQADLGLMLRISHKCGKVGAQILRSMVVLEHLASSRVVDMQIKGTFKQGGNEVGRDPIRIDKRRNCQSSMGII